MALKLTRNNKELSTIELFKGAVLGLCENQNIGQPDFADKVWGNILSDIQRGVSGETVVIVCPIVDNGQTIVDYKFKNIDPVKQIADARSALEIAMLGVVERRPKIITSTP